MFRQGLRPFQAGLLSDSLFVVAQQTTDDIPSSGSADFDIALSGKSSGSVNTDALTIADLTVQELLVAALRDSDSLFRRCRLEAEEATGRSPGTGDIIS